MKRKCSIFLAITMVLQLLLSSITIVSAEEESVAYQAPESPAVTYNMNVDWKYKRAADNAVFPLATAAAGVAKDGKQFYDVDYDDSDWETVSVPHAINAEDSFDGAGLDAGEASLYRGFMFYRKNITIPASDAGKKLILEIEAIRQSVYLYANGQMVGYYEAGIAPIGFDITDYVTPGEEAVIAIATDNAASRGSSFNTQETIPGHTPGDLSGVGYQWNTKDFNEVQGGLTGNVILYAKNKIYQTLPLYNNLKTSGNYIYGSNFDFRENSADVTVEAEVRNETGEAKDITLEVNVVDGDGNLVSTFSKTENVPAATDTENDQFLTMVPDNAYDGNGTGLENNDVDTSTVDVTKITATQNISDMHFWSDVSPYLYTVYTVLKDGDNVIDVQEKETGFREVKYDNINGLQINGKTTYLKGYAQRSTNEWAAIGVANDWLEDIDMQLIKESNANFIRWMHVAPKPNAIRSGDKYGVISIAPAGDKEGDTTGRNWDQRVEAMRDVILYYRNSPSVIFYEAGNNQISPDHMREMTELRKELDPNGGRMMGCRTISSPEQIAEAEWAGTMLYRNGDAAYASMQQLNHYIPILETEYHRNEAPRRVWDDYSPPYYDYVNKWLGDGASKTDGYDIWDQTQEDFSRTMFNSGDGYSYYYNNRVSGTGKNEYSGAAMMVWSDSNMHVRNCGVENARTSGRVDPVRIKKESFYAIQAAQSDTPAIHILGHWNYPEYIAGDKENGNYWYEDKTYNGTYWEPNGTMLQRDPTKKTVYVIGSEGLSKVELYVNDNLVGTDTKPDDNFIFAFDNIDVTQSGRVYAKAYNERDEVVAEDEIKTVGEAATIRLTPVTGPDGLIADGSDLAYFDVEVVDSEGNVCPLDERKINFTINGEGVFLGGYNSGVDDRIVNHKDYVYAECGVNRVFVRSTRNAGDIVLTASAEGMQPVSVTISSSAIDVQNGLTTQMQRAFKQGEVPPPPQEQTAPALKSLGESFTADWTEGTGNVVTVSDEAKDYYTVTVNGTEVQFTDDDKAYRPDSNTGVVANVNKVLDAIKAAGSDMSYTFTTTGSIPEYAYGDMPYLSIFSGGVQTDVVNISTNIFVDGATGGLMNFGVAVTEAGDGLMAELSSILGQINGVTFTTDSENKTLAITVTPAPVSGRGYLTYSDGGVTVTAEDEDINDANLIFAGYNEDGALVSMQVNKVSVAAGSDSDVIPVDEDTLNAASSKAMLWSSNISDAMPLADAIWINGGVTADESVSLMSADTLAAGTVDGIYEHDSVEYENDCSAVIDGLVVGDGTSPDGTSYLQNVDGDPSGKGNGVCFGGLAENSKADIMWEADVRFDTDGSGITPYDNGDKKLGTCIRRHDVDGAPKLSIQTGSTSFTNYADIDPQKWYHIVLIGRYSAADANTDMIVYEYDGEEKNLIGTFTSVNQRNMSANNNNGASHLNIHMGTSIDNVRITKLGADTITVVSEGTEVTAGNIKQFTYEASRQGAYITKPAVTWELYDADNAAPLEDENISIDQSGILNVGINAAEQTVYVRATADSGITAGIPVTVKAVDTSNVKFDSLTLTADRDYVSVDEPLTINVAAQKDGEDVELTDDDLIWYVCDSDNMRSLGTDLKWIKVENGVLTVDEKAVSQDITVRAADSTDSVRGSIKIHIKSSDALEGNEDGSMDRLLYSDSCETPIANAELVAGAPDGTSAYYATAGYQTGHISETAGDVVIEMDIKFNQEGAGFQPAKNGKLNTCVIYHNGQLAVQTGSSDYTNYGEISPDKWYHITIIRKMESYAHIIFEEYDENGERTNRRLIKDVNQRNDEPTAFVNINAGTSYDNLRVLTPVPDSITISTDVQTVFAGGTVQATAQLFWNELEMKSPDSSMFEFKIYDAENKYPLDSDLITVDGTGLVTIDPIAEAQDIYVRAQSKVSDSYASAKVSIASSDIFNINKIGVDESGTKIVRLFASKNFYYADEVTFITAVYDENGAVKTISSRQMYGDALATGENEITVDVTLPDDFNKDTDTVKVFTVTKVSTDDVTEPAGDLAVTKSGNSVTLDTVPDYDKEGIVLIIKGDADETALTAEDILYFNEGLDVKDGFTASWAQDYTGSCIVKTAGTVNGVLTVSAAAAE